MPDESIASLKGLLSEREMYASDKAKYQGILTDQKDFTSKPDYADKSKQEHKIVFHVCAVSVVTIKKDGEFREYYLRKVAEGKNKESVA